MVKKSGLGRGLSALIPTSKETTAQDKYQELSINILDPNPEQPRNVFHEEQLLELANSIKHNGVIQPIIVTPKGQRFVVIAGERRWRASKLAGYEKIPAVIRSIKQEQMLSLALLENIQRAELNPIEEGMAYTKLLKADELTQDELANRLGKSRATITNTVRLLKLPTQVKNMIQDGILSFGHARCLVGIEDTESCLRMAGSTYEKQWSVRELEKRIRASREAKKGNKSTATKNPSLKQLAQGLSQTLRSKVTIGGDGKKGKVAIAYNSEEELQKLIEMFESKALESAEHGG